MKQYSGVLERVGSWSGQGGNKGGRMEFIDIGGTHVRRIGCTSYQHDGLVLGVGEECTVYLTGVFGFHELLGVRFADGRSYVAGKSRLIALVLALVIGLSLTLMLTCTCPTVLLTSTLFSGSSGGAQPSGIGATLGMLLIFLVGAAAVLGPIALAVIVVRDYKAATKAISTK